MAAYHVNDTEYSGTGFQGHEDMTRYTVGATALAFIAIYILTGLWGQDNWAYNDQVIYHIPFANLLVERGLNPFGPSFSATTPGAHLVYAMVALSIGAVPLTPNSQIIGVLGSAISATTLGLLLFSYQRISRGWVWAPLLLLPVFASQYFLLPGAFLVTDGLTYLWLAIFFAATQSRFEPIAQQTIAAIALAGLVLTRQIYLPVSMVMMFFFLISPTHLKQSLGLRQAGFVLFPLIIFLPFLISWQGVVPPEFASHTINTFNFSAILQSIALLGFFTLPLLPALWRATKYQGRLIIYSGIIFVSLLMITCAPTDFNIEAGRFGSLIWTLSKLEHSVTGLPLLVFFLFSLGTGMSIWAIMSNTQIIRISALGYIAYTLSLAMQSFAWQRYSEVFALMLISLIAARLLPSARPWQIYLFGVFFTIWMAANFAIRIA
jgi:hypothetical protein